MLRSPRAFCVFLVLSALAACSDPAELRDKYLASGDRYVAQHQDREAVLEYRNAVQQDPRNGPIRYKLAEAYLRIGDPANAYREFIRAADAMPGNPAAQLKAAYFLLGARQFEDARSRAELAVKLDPKSVEAHVLLGSAMAGLGDLDSAVKQVEDATRIAPESTLAFTSLGSLQLAGGSAASAEAAYRKAIALDPRNVAAHQALGHFLWVRGRLPEADQALHDAVDMAPDDLLGRRLLAAFLIATGHVMDAEPHLKVMADHDTQPSAPWKLQLADYYAATARRDRAREVLGPLSQRPALSSAVQTRLARLSLLDGKRDEASREVSGVLQRDPQFVPALLFQARLRLLGGDAAGALR